MIYVINMMCAHISIDYHIYQLDYQYNIAHIIYTNHWLSYINIIHICIIKTINWIRKIMGMWTYPNPSTVYCWIIWYMDSIPTPSTKNLGSYNMGLFQHIASGKRLHNYGKSPFLWQNPRNKWQFSIANC